MARLVGPDEGSRLAYGIRADNTLTTGGGLPATVYADAGATTLADILTYPGGAVVPGSVLSVGASSLLPLFQFPDGADVVYGGVGVGGGVFPVYARTDDRLDALATRVGTVEGVAAGLGNAATRNVGTTAGTVAQGDDSRIAGAAQRTAVFQWGHRWAFIGDSITNGSAAANFAWSYAPRTTELAGYNLIRPDSFEAGVPGERSDQMLARLAAVETSGATSFFVLAGTNDAAQGVSVTSYASTMTQIITRLRALGRVLVGTVPPRWASDPAAYHTSIEGYNAWLRTFGPILGAQVVDVWTALADPTTGRLAAAYDSGDGTHPNTLGHLRIARVVAAAIRGSAPPWQGWITSEGQPGNYIADALCDSGTTRPSGWFEWPNGTGTVPTYSLAADTTGRLPAGRWAQVDITAAAATSRILSSPAITVTAGDRLALCLLAEVDDISGDWEATANAATAWNARVVNQSGAAITSARPGRAVGYSVVAGTYRMPPLLWPFTLPAGTTSTNIWLEHTLSAGQHYTFRYGCIGLVNLTSLGLQSLFDFGSNSLTALA